MRLNFGILLSIIANLFIMVYADTQVECLSYCERACNTDFLPRLTSLLHDTIMLSSEYETFEPYWTSCQYRCYRCHLPGAIRAMRYLKNIYSVDDQKSFITSKEITAIAEVVDQSLKSCYSNWKAANEAEDHESNFE